MDREPLSSKIGNRLYFKNKQPEKWNLKWRPEYRIICFECDGHYLHIENQATGKLRSCNIKDIVLNHKWNSGTLTHNLAQLENTSTTQPMCQTLCLMTEDEYFTHVNSHLLITCTHLLYRTLYIITLIDATVTWEIQESVLFQSVLKAHPALHSRIITTHISLGNLEKQYRMFFK